MTTPRVRKLGAKLSPSDFGISCLGLQSDADFFDLPAGVLIAPGPYLTFYLAIAAWGEFATWLGEDETVAKATPKTKGWMAVSALRVETGYLIEGMPCGSVPSYFVSAPSTWTCSLVDLWGPRLATTPKGSAAGGGGFRTLLQLLRPYVAFAARNVGGRRLRWAKHRRLRWAKHRRRRLCRPHGRDLPWMLRQRGLWLPSDADLVSNRPAVRLRSRVRHVDVRSSMTGRRPRVLYARLPSNPRTAGFCAALAGQDPRTWKSEEEPQRA